VPINTGERASMKGPFPYYGPTKIQDWINEYRLDGKYALIGEDGDHFLKFGTMPMTQLVEGRFNVNNHAHLIQGTTACTTEWFFQYFKHRDIGSFLTRQGAGRYKLNKKSLERLPILVPPKEEQLRIHEILTCWDNAIRTVESLISNSEQQRKALMQRLLSGKSRLLGYTREWTKSRIDEISTRVTRRNDGGEHPILTISSTAGFVAQKDKYSRYMAGKSVEKYTLLSQGEFAYNKGNSKTFQFGCIFDLEQFAVALVPHVYVCFRLNADLSPRFFKHLFASDYLRPQLGQLVNTGVRNNGLLNITPKAFLGTRVPVPPKAEQEAISKVMDAMSNQIGALQKNRTALKGERGALMQKLLRGKLRVKVREAL
jgi:type I restriction enzyme S subunit